MFAQNSGDGAVACLGNAVSPTHVPMAQVDLLHALPLRIDMTENETANKVVAWMESPGYHEHYNQHKAQREACWEAAKVNEDWQAKLHASLQSQNPQ